MRIKRSASFPHPILSDSTGDYGSKKFQLSLEIQEQASIGNVYLSGNLSLDDTEIVALLDSGKAASGLMIYCQGTYLDRFEPRNLGDIHIDLSGGILRGPVHVRGVVVALQDELKLESTSIDAEFPDNSKIVNAGALLAATDELNFEAGLEKLAPMESIFKLKLAEDLDEDYFDIDFDGEAIEILAAPRLHQFLSLLREQPSKETLLSSLYLPVVMAVLETMRDGEAYEDRRWYSVVSARCNARSIDVTSIEVARNAQLLMDYPLAPFRNFFEKLVTS